jgi:hypothetical protein
VTAAAAALAADESATRSLLRQLDRPIRHIAGGAEGGVSVDLDDPYVVSDLLAQARDALDARLAERQG